MSKPYHSLPEALRGVISEMGDRVIEDTKLVNIIADMCSLEDVSIANSILKKMLSDGYGYELLKISADQTWEVKIKLLSSKIASQNGFREDITLYIIESIIYGLGKSDRLPKPVYVSNNQSCSITDLEIELKKLKGEYISFLEENIMVADDKPASYNTNDKSEIYEYREKIRMLNDVFGNKDISWCDDKMKEIRDKYSQNLQKTKKRGFFKRLFGS